MTEPAFLKLAAARRSIRKYKPLPVERERLQYCLEAARLAPSACNAQPYKFIVVDEPEAKEKLAKAAFSGIYAPCSFAAAAGALVVVVSQTGKMSAWLGNQVRDTNFRLVDIGIAAEHFVLAAEEQGLGTCWLGWFNARAAARALNIPRALRPEIMLSVGWPDEAPPARKRKSMEELASFNKY
ncbi:MAG: nitroreductase family protein [Elusimicrobia bacterium]|nr:nitroreductase family protein [Elusimicrobiota bacterium]